jgi:thiamine biosynthesis lipoprotein
MGTILEITLVASDSARAHALIERCFAETARLEMIFTTWREDGELARLNAKAGQGPQPVSPESMRILLDAQRFTRDTGGAFDVTVGPLVSLWRDAGKRGTRPDDAEIAAARARVGAARIQIDAVRGTIALEAGMSVDLGGLAKGWALDRLGEVLRKEGVDRALLNFGGSSLLAIGTPLDAQHWRVSVEGGEILELLPEISVSVSSSFGQFVEIDGARFSHIIDPRTGWPTRRARRAIVEAPDGALAEAWSTALVVLNGERECAKSGENFFAMPTRGGAITGRVGCDP